MTVKQLKEALRHVSDSMDVFIEKHNDDFTCTLVENAQVQQIKFSDGENEADEIVFIISD